MTNSKKSPNVSIAGCGIAGLAVALALPQDVNITIFDENAGGGQSHRNRAVPQIDQVHALVHGGLAALNRIAPEVLVALSDRGYRTADACKEMHYTEGDGHTPSVSSDLRTLFVQRADLDEVMFTEAMKRPNITFVCHEVTDLEIDEINRRVNVRTRNNDIRPCDFAVCAIGRRRVTFSPLEAVQRAKLRLSEVALSIQTAVYAWGNRRPENWKALVYAEPPPRGRKGSYVIDLDGTIFSVAHGVRGGKSCEPTKEAMVAFADGFHDKFVANLLKGSELVRMSRPYHFKEASLVDFASAQRLPPGIVTVGDAHVSTNPMYGLGAAMAFIGAEKLATAWQRMPQEALWASLGSAYYRSVDPAIKSAWGFAKLADDQFPISGGTSLSTLVSGSLIARDRWRVIEDSEIIRSFLEVAQLKRYAAPLAPSEVSKAVLRSFLRRRCDFRPSITDISRMAGE